MPPESTQPAGTPERFVFNGPQEYQVGEASSSQVTLDRGDDDRTSPRKRYRSDRDQELAPPESIIKNPGPPPPGNTVFDSASGLDPALTRELVNR
jgi:hypothetical protein